MRRIRYFWILYSGNLWACNRRYWGWVSVRTAWDAAACLARKGET